VTEMIPVGEHDIDDVDEHVDKHVLGSDIDFG